MKVVGIKLSTGEYEGHKYENYILYATDADVKGIVAGICPSTIKVKASRVPDILAVLNMHKIEDLMNKNIVAYYDAYKNCSKIELL